MILGKSLEEEQIGKKISNQNGWGHKGWFFPFKLPNNEAEEVSFFRPPKNQIPKDRRISWAGNLEDLGVLEDSPSSKLTWQWNIHHLKSMYFLLKMGKFRCYVRLPECKRAKWPQPHWISWTTAISSTTIHLGGWGQNTREMANPDAKQVGSWFTNIYHQNYPKCR